MLVIHTNARRILTLMILLAYLLQSSSALSCGKPVNHTLEVEASRLAHCDEKPADIAVTPCCDEGCLMAHCHAVSAILGGTFWFAASYGHHIVTSFLIASPLASNIATPFRPPLIA